MLVVDTSISACLTVVFELGKLKGRFRIKLQDLLVYVLGRFVRQVGSKFRCDEYV